MTVADDLAEARATAELHRVACEQLRAERDAAQAALVARHGGEPVALLAELDAARAERDSWRTQAQAEATCTETLSAECERLRTLLADSERIRDRERETVEHLRGELAEARVAALAAVVDGICSAATCEGHCGLSGWRGCDVIKERLRDMAKEETP